MPPRCWASASGPATGGARRGRRRPATPTPGPCARRLRRAGARSLPSAPLPAPPGPPLRRAAADWAGGTCARSRRRVLWASSTPTAARRGLNMSVFTPHRQTLDVARARTSRMPESVTAVVSVSSSLLRARRVRREAPKHKQKRGARTRDRHLAPLLPPPHPPPPPPLNPPRRPLPPCARTRFEPVPLAKKQTERAHSAPSSSSSSS
jgi:hypothetical protein